MLRYANWRLYPFNYWKKLLEYGLLLMSNGAAIVEHSIAAKAGMTVDCLTSRSTDYAVKPPTPA
jgi:hypothetical protein